MPKKAQILINRYSFSAGFTLMEMVLASSLSILVVVFAGIGLLTMVSSDNRNNTETELIDALNRASTFISEEIRQGQSVAIRTDISTPASPYPVIPSTGTGTNATTKVLGIVNPNFSTQQIIYYTAPPRSQDRLTGPRVLYRYGPTLNSDGSYNDPTNPNNWGISPVADMIPSKTDTSVLKECPVGSPGDEWTQSPENDTDTDGFFVCVNGTNRVNIRITGKMQATGTSSPTVYSLDTNAFARAKER